MPKLKKQKGKKKSLIWNYLLAIILIIIILNLASLFFLEKKQEEVKTEEMFSSGVSMRLPAIDSEGKGMTTFLNVEVKPGTGKTLIDVDNLLFWADTQHSIRIAKLVAENITGKNIKNYDIIYSVKANASVIGGPSAGAALTIATIFAIQNKTPNEKTMITGTINHDGTIGPVSTILEKAKASKQAQASMFLVPLLQSQDVIYETNQHCETFGLTEICTSETIPKKINVTEEAGIQVIEVSSIQEALKYF